MKKKKPIIAIKADKNSKPIVFTGDKPNNSIREILDKFNADQKKLRDKLKAIELNHKEPLADLTKKIAETNDKIKKTLKPQTDAVSLLTGKPIEFKSYNPFLFSNRLPKDKSGIMSLLSRPDDKTGRRIRYLVPKIRPEGHKRKPITGTGLSSYMDRHKIENPVDFAKTYLTKKGKDYKIKGHINLRFLCEQMNVTVEEALLYICEGMRKSHSRWREHRINKEYWRGSQDIINLVGYFDEKVAFHKKKKELNAYTIKSLYNSQYVKDLFKNYGCVTGSYSEFTRWFKQMKHHVYAYRLAQKMKSKK